MAIAERPPADKPGPDIVDSVLVSTVAQLERGRQEINYHSTDRVLKVGALINSDHVQPGVLREIQDKSGGVRGKVTKHSVNISVEKEKFSISTNIEVECVT